MHRPRVLISYSHDSAEHSRRVLALAGRLRLDGIDVLLDQYVEGTPAIGWPRWMTDGLSSADFVLMVCTETYRRRFLGREQPDRGYGADWEGHLITNALYNAHSQSQKFVPVLLEDTAKEHIPEPLRGHTFYTLTSRDAYEKLYVFLRGQAGAEAPPLGPLRDVSRESSPILDFDDDQRIAASRLPAAPEQLFGREKELAALEDAWQDPGTHLVSLVAWGGVGKTSLVGTWVAQLAGRGFDGADYFDWSFYSQGTREHGGASADPFIDKALRFFGDEQTAGSARSPWDKGERLAALVAARRTLLVLDGAEPLQHAPGPLRGQLKDDGLRALLRGLATRNAGLCVVTTRESMADLAGFRAGTAPEWQLEHLGKEAGVALLEELGVEGARGELKELVRDVRGHALTLNLVGRFLRDAHGGDVRQRDVIDLHEADEEEQGGHAFRAMEAYERWLDPPRSFFQRLREAFGPRKDKHLEGRQQVAILRLLGLFDRPAAADCLAALRRPPAIAGLTETIVALKDTGWNMSVSRLVDASLLSRDGDSLDAHPLVREHFARRLQEQAPEAAKEAHGRLFDHLKDVAEHRPDTLDGLQPLYQAVVHGCRAGRHQEACDDVYHDRISRGSEDFAVHKLAAFGADLGAVACFFDQPWGRVSPRLSDADQAWLLNQAASRLQALGRLREAVEPMRAGLRFVARREDWRNAAIGASNLSQLERTLGDIDAAVRDAEQAVDFANRSGNAFQRMVNRATLADVLHQAGQRHEALERFRQAESMQAERQPQYPQLYSVQGFLYCDLLLAGVERAVAGAGGANEALREQLDAVERRASEALPVAQKNNRLLAIGLDHLTLGRVRLCRTLLGGSVAADAESLIEQAVDGLRRAASLDHLPRGLLTRAWLRFAQDRHDDARADLAEAEEIARRGPMPLYLADVALYRARFFEDRDALAEARRLIDAHGYGRRLEELAALEASMTPE